MSRHSLSLADHVQLGRNTPSEDDGADHVGETKQRDWMDLCLDAISFGTLQRRRKAVRKRAQEAPTPLPGLPPAHEIPVRRGSEIVLSGQRFIVLDTQHEDDWVIMTQSDTTVELSSKPDDNRIWSRVLICAYLDTLPISYKINLFSEYLKPFFLRHPTRRYQLQERFSIDGIQFKLVAGRGALHRSRIGSETTILIGKPIKPHWSDIVTHEQLRHLAGLPPHLQASQLTAILSQSSMTEIERILGHWEDDEDDAGVIVERCRTIYADAVSGGHCVICMTTIAGDAARLNCDHTFHMKCLIHWLLRSKTCPVCKCAVKLD